MLLYNFSFFSKVFSYYPVSIKNIINIASLFIVFSSALCIVLTAITYKKTTKPTLIIIIFTSSITAYFMDSYHIIIDSNMIQNSIKTDTGEVFDLLSIKLVIYILLLGLLPSYLIIKTPIIKQKSSSELKSKAKTLSLSLFLSILTIIVLSGFYASFIRENKIIRSYSNPLYPIYSAIKYASSSLQQSNQPFIKISEGSHISENDIDKDLVIFVVGETARYDRFSINGYKKPTNPFLKNDHVISFNNFWSCGTSTAVSVPCMFSEKNRSEYKKNINRENLLDILAYSGVNVLWLDNNSDSKGVAIRANYKSFKSPDTNSLCNPECRDEGMLVNLQTYINRNPEGDIFIVLHQMGSHGPAYYKRYPKDFERFVPTCQSNQLQTCSEDEINNTYDNTILYTDYFLHQVIELLKNNDDEYETAMLYVSDHGESLGENHIYLHGLPYSLAPNTQTHVPFIVWLGKNFDPKVANRDQLNNVKNQEFSHDNLFHTLLKLFEINSPAYNPTMDITNK